MSGFEWYTRSTTERVEQAGAPAVVVRSAKLADDSIRGKLIGSEESQRAAILSTCCFDEDGNQLPYEVALTFDVTKSQPLMNAFYRVNGLSAGEVEESEKN